MCGCDLPRVRVTTERRGPGPAHVLTPWHDTGASPSSPPATHPWSEGGSIPGRDIEESVPSLLIVLLDFVLKVLKLCLFFDELFRVRMSEEHHTVTKHKSPFLVTWDIFLRLYEDDVTWSRMPDNEVMMFVMRLGHWCHSLLRDCWLILLTVLTWRWHGAMQSRVHPGVSPGGWPQSSHASFVHESGLWAMTFFLTNLPDISVLCIAPWGLCVIWVRESWVSVSQHSAKSHELMTVLFVEILPEKECSYYDCLLEHFNHRQLVHPFEA